MTNAEYLAQAKARLTQYLLAETNVLKGQSYTIGERSLTRADLDFIQKQITALNKLVLKMSRGRGIRVQIAVPRDI